MALRTIREYGDEILTKPCKEVKFVTPGILLLIGDLLDTMYDAGGVGLAAPQVGILKRICVVDVSGEDGEPDPHVFINPVLLDTEGEQEGYEGCLSLPGKSGIVRRPSHIRVRAYDKRMQPFEMEADELLARAICHEIDHLEGRMFVELVEGELVNNEDIEEEKAD